MVEGDKIIQEDSEIADVLGEAFSNAVKSLNITIPSECKNDVSPKLLNDPIDNIISTYSRHPSIKLINNNVVKGDFLFQEVSLEDIEKEIASLDDKKSTSFNSIPPKLLKENSDICCKPLRAIINAGISNSCFDAGLKFADLTPVHKAGETISKKNYRNISLLPVVSKIFEFFLQSQVSPYMEEFLSPFLCGYRKGYSPQYRLTINARKVENDVR